MGGVSTSVLFIDDDADVRKSAELLLRKAGYAFSAAATVEEGLSRLVSDPVDVVLLDLNFATAQTSGEEGLACLADILRHDPHTPVIVVTGYSGLNVAVRAIRAGAQDLIAKPWHKGRLIEAIESAVASRRPAKVPVADPSIMIGASEAMAHIKVAIDRYAPLTAPVFLTGEAGTGKTMVATALHRKSRRTTFLARDAGGLAEADFEACADTTLVIENIDRLAERHIPGVLSWLRRGALHNSRLVATSTRGRGDLGLEKGLVYAICTLEFALPPLSERPDDIVPLAEHFARIACRQNGLGERHFDAGARAALVAHAWPDNIHALRHVVERAVILSADPVIAASDLALGPGHDASSEGVKPRLAQSEKTLIEDALKRNNFNVSAAATQLGLTRPALYRRMSKYGL
jgi:DNA-binding NtrC family response regulator